MKLSLFLLLVILSSGIVFANVTTEVSPEKWICYYKEGIHLTLPKAHFYQCPPVLKRFYSLTNQEVYTEPTYISPSGGGGVGYWQEVIPNETVKGEVSMEFEKTVEKPKLSIIQKILLTFLFAAFLALIFWLVDFYLGNKKIREEIDKDKHIENNIIGEKK